MSTNIIVADLSRFLCLCGSRWPIFTPSSNLPPANSCLAILGQQLFHLVDPPTPPTNGWSSEKLVRYPIQVIPEGYNMSSRARPYFPDPDTVDNHIAINDLGFGPSTLTTQDSTGRPAGRWSALRRP